MIPYSDIREDRLLNMNHRCHEDFPDIATKREVEEVGLEGKKQYCSRRSLLSP